MDANRIDFLGYICVQGAALDMTIHPQAPLVKDGWHLQVFHGTSGPWKDCARLRFSYFVEQRSWVEENPAEPGEERDAFDPYSVHVAVYSGDGVSAYLRLLPFDPQMGFMLDGDLACVLNDHARLNLPRENSVEVSRLVVRQDLAVNPSGVGYALELLFKRFYQESRARGFTLFYIVVEPSWLRLFARRFGLIFRVLGVPYVFPDGTRTVAAMATLEELEAGMRRFCPEKLAWYQDTEWGEG